MNAGHLLRQLALLTVAQSLLLSGCSGKNDSVFHGYIEGDYVQVSCPLSGILATLDVARGASIQKGAPLFALDSVVERAAVAEARARLKQAEARRDDLKKGVRATELASLTARLEQAQAVAALSSSNAIRTQALLAGGNASPSELDQAQRRQEADAAQVASLASDLSTAGLGGREDMIRAAEADVDAAIALVDKAQWSLDQKVQTAPGAGIVEDTIFRVGEFVPAGRPIVRLLPPENIKVRFFIPQALLPSFAPGATVQVFADGHTAPLTATVSFVSSQVEFTPPVIYSRENREKLVFMVEAIFAPDVVTTLHPGQPVDVSLAQPK